MSQKIQKNKSNISITENNSIHIARITNDSLILISGSTYLFTVDTPEDGGLISTTVQVPQLLKQIKSLNGISLTYKILDKESIEKKSGVIDDGDRLIVASKNKIVKTYFIAFKQGAVGGQLVLDKNKITANLKQSLTLYFTAGQRSPNTTVRIYLPKGIDVTPENTTVNVIGRGDVFLKDLATQSMGRLGSDYPYKKVGNFAISKDFRGGSVLLFKHLDLRPQNGYDLKITINDVTVPKVGSYNFKAQYTTSQPGVLTSPGIGAETATLTALNTIADFERIPYKEFQYVETNDMYTKTAFKWNENISSPVQILQSINGGKTWKLSRSIIDISKSKATISGLEPGKLYAFKLSVKDGVHKGFSNIVKFYSGKMDVKEFDINGNDKEDNTEKINKAIAYLNELGGGTLFFSKGIYNVRTIHLKSNVYLFVGKDAVIKALKGNDIPESTWFSDKKYRSGLSPTSSGPYDNPQNWLTKQDVGHHYFRNCMFFAERLNNVKIIGNGLITGNGNLVNSDKVMNNPADNRADKMFVFKLCTNVEIGGIYRKEDIWYDEQKDEPYYINTDGSKDYHTDNMLQIERGGHFALLATGTDTLNVHDTYFGKYNQSNVRDIYDFMACNFVRATNIYSKVSSDDIIKPGSDCSLGFTRPAKDYKVRNIIGDTNCNLFQIGSETADDITDIHVDNIYVLGANKAGFSISTNDGATIRNIHLNCGHTGSLHSRSKMLRTTTPFFISISNRGRVLGADVKKFKFNENGTMHDELLVTNINIGSVENIILNGIDVAEVYGGSSYGKKQRWKAYDGSQRKATAIVAGYALPDPSQVEGGLDFKLPNGEHTGYIKNIEFNDVHILVKGGNPVSDTTAAPPELGVGQYNVSNLKTQPSYGLWARHVKGLTITNSSFNYEKRDSRYPLFLNDVIGASLSSLQIVKATDNPTLIKLENSSGIAIDKNIYYNDEWGNSPAQLKALK